MVAAASLASQGVPPILLCVVAVQYVTVHAFFNDKQKTNLCHLWHNENTRIDCCTSSVAAKNPFS